MLARRIETISGRGQLARKGMMPMGGHCALVLAAGQGTRMKSDLLKVLHPVAGRPMIDRVVGAVEKAGLDRCLVVTGVQEDAVRGLLGDRAVYAHQKEQLGTGHAVMQARHLIDPESDIVILYGDSPLLTPDILQHLLERHREGKAAATILTANLPDPSGYGRVVRRPDGEFSCIREHADCSPEELSLSEINTGMGVFRASDLFEVLPRLDRDNAAGEYYLVDALAMFCELGLGVVTVEAADPCEVLGVNTRVDLARAERAIRDRHLEQLMLAGVTVVDPGSTFIDDTVTVGHDTVIHPFTVMEGPGSVGCRCRIGPSSHLVRSRVGDGVVVRQSVVEDSHIGDGSTVGPFSHLRPGTDLSPQVRVGNFAEIKNSTVGVGSKIPHHSYVGDAEIGAGVNIGAGVITVNYDGKKKHRTVIRDRSFVGCNANLIAPLEVGRRGFVGAGTTVTGDVPPETLALGRAKQVNYPGWVARRMGKDSEDQG